MSGFALLRPLGILPVSVALLAGPGSAGAVVPSGNLVQNPGAEASVGAGPPGWGANAEFASVAYGSPGFPTAAHSASIGGASNFFAGGSGAASTVAEQTFDVSGAAAEIDTGGVSVQLRAHLGGFLTDGDNTRVVTEFQDAPADVTFATRQIGPVTAADRQNETTLLQRAVFGTVPPGTRRIRLTLTATRTHGAHNDGYADNVSLTLDDPVAVDDSATVSQNAPPAAIDVLANDTNTYGGPRQVDSATQPPNGTVAITGGGSGLTYQPRLTYCNSQAGAVPDRFTYALNEGSTAIVSVSVPCIDQPPVAVADAVTIASGSGPTPIDVLANDTDADGGPKQVVAITQGARGAVAIGGGSVGVTYAPTGCNADVGATPDTFTYTLNGGSTATVTVNVPCVFPTSCTLTGTPGPDRLTGCSGADRMSGLAGDDTMNGLAGNDRMDGGSGDDTVFGDQQNDSLYGGSGRDTLRGDAGNDRLSGGTDGDTLNAGTGNDRVSGGSGDDRLTGSTGQDALSGSSGDDRLSGGSGNDRLAPGSGRDLISGESGNDRMSARDRSRDRIDCGSGRDTVSADNSDQIARNCERVSRR